MALKIHAMSCGVGGSHDTSSRASTNYRLVFFTTPVDDETSDMFYSIWWPREAGTRRQRARASS